MDCKKSFFRKILFSFLFCLGFSSYSFVDQDICALREVFSRQKVNFDQLVKVLDECVPGYWGYDFALDWYEYYSKDSVNRDSDFVKIIQMLHKNRFPINSSHVTRAKKIKMQSFLINIFEAGVVDSTLKYNIKKMALNSLSSGIPIILCQILYLVYPEIFSSPSNRIVFSLLIGMFVSCLCYKRTKAFAYNCEYKPSLCRPELEEVIVHCGVDPKSIHLAYSNLNESVAQAGINAILIDPEFFHKIAYDPEAIKQMSKYKSVVDPVLKKSKEKVKKSFTSLFQVFCLKHELGHIVASDSYKSILRVGIIRAISLYVGLEAAFNYFALFGFCLAGPILNISDNIIKAIEEKNADLFAAKFSSREEIESAASFFELNEEVIDFVESPNTLLKIIFDGMFNGKARAKYLRDFIKNKNI